MPDSGDPPRQAAAPRRRGRWRRAPGSGRGTLRDLLRERHGNVAVVLAVALPAVFAFAALSIDMSYAYWMRNKVQITASTAALAAASQLPDQAEVIATARTFAEKNMATGRHGIVMQDSDVVLGNWDEDSLAFTPAATPFNAVQVTARRTGDNGNALDLFLSPVIGKSSTDISASAIAVFGSRTVWDVVVVQDVTVSFAGEIDEARVADVSLLSCIRNNLLGSQVGLAAFTGVAHNIEDILPVGEDEDYQTLQQAIDGFQTCDQPDAIAECSGTHIAAGIEKAIELFANPLYEPASGEVQKAIVLVSGGVPNPGGPNEGLSVLEMMNMAIDQANAAAAQDISVYAVYLEQDEFSQDAALAQEFFPNLIRGQGVFEYTTDPDDLETLLSGICEDRLALRLVE